jgi:hypothetical protein
MVFVDSIVGEVFIFIAIVGSGLALAGGAGFLIYRRCKQRQDQTTVEDAKQDSDKLDESRHLSKISVTNWQQSPNQEKLEKPLILQQDSKGDFHVKNPSVAARNDLPQRNENKVLLIDEACNYHLQQA